MRLREARVRALLSLRDLAEAAGVGPKTIWGIEHGHQKPQLSSIKKIAEALRVPPAEIDEFRFVIEARISDG